MLEYKVINLGVAFSSGKGVEKAVQEKCDLMAKQGYELVNFQSYDASTKILLIFKRDTER
jgi:hypothetical protein